MDIQHKLANLFKATSLRGLGLGGRIEMKTWKDKIVVPLTMVVPCLLFLSNMSFALWIVPCLILLSLWLLRMFQVRRLSGNVGDATALTFFFFVLFEFSLAQVLFVSLDHILPDPLIDYSLWPSELQGDLKPESAERITWFLMLLVSPLVALTSVRIGLITSRMFQSSNRAFFCILCATLTLMIPSCYRIRFSDMMILLCCFYGLQRLGRERLRRTIWWLCLAGMIAIQGLLCLLMCVSDIDGRLSSSSIAHHFAIVLYPFALMKEGVFQAHQYGQYYRFLKPALDVLGYSVANVTLLLSSLAFVSSISLMVCCYFVLRLKSLVVVIFFALLWIWPFLPTHYLQHYPYFQYHPIRTFFPMVLPTLWWCRVRASRDLAKVMLDVTILVGCAIAFFWNTDYGVATCLASFVLLIGLHYVEFGFKRAVVHGIWGSVLFMVVSAGLYVAFSMQGGNWSWLMNSFEFQRIFYISGFFMLPMGNVFSTGAWMPITLFFLLMAVGVKNLCNNGADDEKKRSVFYVSFAVLSFGVLTYYQGRSHPTVLLHCLWPSFCAATFLFDELCQWKGSLESHREWMRIFALLPLAVWMAMAASQGVRHVRKLKLEGWTDLPSNNIYEVAKGKMRTLIMDNKLAMLNVFCGNTWEHPGLQALLYMNLPVRPSISAFNRIEILTVPHEKHVIRQMLVGTHSCVPFLVDTAAEKKMSSECRQFANGYATLRFSGLTFGVESRQAENFDWFTSTVYENGDCLNLTAAPVDISDGISLRMGKSIHDIIIKVCLPQGQRGFVEVSSGSNDWRRFELADNNQGGWICISRTAENLISTLRVKGQRMTLEKIVCGCVRKTPCGSFCGHEGICLLSGVPELESLGCRSDSSNGGNEMSSRMSAE